MFSRGSQPKPSFATATGRGDNPSYHLQNGMILQALQMKFQSPRDPSDQLTEPENGESWNLNGCFQNRGKTPQNGW